MTRRTKLLLFFATLIGSTLAVAPKAHAQHGPGRSINCSSKNMQRTYCPIGNTRDVKLIRQIGGSPCVRGDTWGVDNRGLWVDRGCRAEFIIGGLGTPVPPALTITCSSENMRRNWCAIGNTRNVQLFRQISRAPCIWSDTWGLDNRGIWVDRGCRAEFTVGHGAPPSSPPPR